MIATKNGLFIDFEWNHGPVLIVSNTEDTMYGELLIFNLNETPIDQAFAKAAELLIPNRDDPY